MSLFNFFFPKRTSSAAVAKERLQIVLAHERAGREGPDFLPALQKDLMEVVAKYVEASDDMIQIKIDRSGNTSVLEINVELGWPAMAGGRMSAGAAAC